MKYEWDLRLSDRVPLDIHVNFGAGQAQLDLGSLDLRGVEVSLARNRTRVRGQPVGPPGPRDGYGKRPSRRRCAWSREHRGILDDSGRPCSGRGVPPRPTGPPRLDRYVDRADAARVGSVPVDRQGPIRVR